MLKPEYFNGKDSAVTALYRELEEYILKDISRRLLTAGQMTGTADRLIWKLEQAGETREAIEVKLKSITGMAQAELRTILQDAVLTSAADDAQALEAMGITVGDPLENEAVRSVIDAEWRKSLGELSNLTRTTADKSQADLINLLDKADMRVTSGAQTYSEAVKDVIDEYAGTGLEVSYPSGTVRTLEAAVRCCIVTSMNQTAAQVTNEYIKEAACEYVLVSAHTGARTATKGQPPLADHASWQGKVYKIEGSEPGYPNLLESTGYDIDLVTGTGAVINPLGLHGYNCRHSHRPWHKELRNPYIDDNGNRKIDTKENEEAYRISQKQRAIEREIRRLKRLIAVKEEEVSAGATTQEELDTLKANLTSQNRRYNDFCEAHNLKPQYDRTYTGQNS